MRIAIVLCASGFSKRFGSNKLLIDVSEPKRVSKKLYQLMIDKLLSAKEILTNKLNELDETKNENKHKIQNKKLVNENDLSNEKNFDVDIVVVSQYDEILNDNNYKDKVFMLKNDNASEGLSASIKLGVEFCKGSHSSPIRTVGASYTSAKQGSARAHSYDAVVFVNADLPHLPDKELANFIFYSILNKNGIAVMYSDDYKNPAYFEKKYFDDLMTLSGDKGARELFDKYKMNVYKYYINNKYLLDIDTKEDLEKQMCKVTL
jgi:molybdenum cofactor cytidylyltransferase